MENTVRSRPHICYCQIPEDKLREMARLRFVEGIPTEELMLRYPDPKDRECLAAVALLDVSPESLPKIVPNDPGLLMHLYDCRGHVKAILEESGIFVEEKELN